MSEYVPVCGTGSGAHVCGEPMGHDGAHVCGEHGAACDTSGCPYCWYSHGCDLPSGHDGDHQCLYQACPQHGDPESGPFDCKTCDEPEARVCCSRPRGHADLFHWKTDEPEVTV